jgi:hypothetical protein
MQDGLIESQRAVYESYAGRGSAFGEDQTIASHDPTEISDRLAAAIEEVGADALNLRVQLPGMAHEEVREQITAVGSMVVGRLRESWPRAR